MGDDEIDKLIAMANSVSDHLNNIQMNTSLNGEEALMQLMAFVGAMAKQANINPYKSINYFIVGYETGDRLFRAEKHTGTVQ